MTNEYQHPGFLPSAPPPPLPPEAARPTTRRKKHTVLWIVLASVGVVITGIVVLVLWGWGVFKDQARDALNANPVIQRHIGRIDTIEFDLMGTGEQEGEEVFVFRIRGPNGSGVVTAEFISDAHGERIDSGTLRLDSGEVFDLMEDANEGDEWEWD